MEKNGLKLKNEGMRDQKFLDVYSILVIIFLGIILKHELKSIEIRVQQSKENIIWQA